MPFVPFPSASRGSNTMVHTTSHAPLFTLLSLVFSPNSVQNTLKPTVFLAAKYPTEIPLQRAEHLLQSTFSDFSVEAMENNAEKQSQNQRRRRKKNMEKWSTRISFSASLPEDVTGDLADSICVVKYSDDPFWDIRESILEMIQSVGVRDWKEMEELVYCYIVLNSPDVHQFIEDAFLSLCSSVEQIE